MGTQRYFEGLTFKVANGAETERALELRSRIYSEELGNPGLDRFDSVALHLIAIDDLSGEVIAALRLLGPAQRPFDLERFVPLTGFLPTDRRPAEVSRFCVQRGHRAVHRGQLVHLGMLKLLYDYATRHGITDLITLGLPDLTKLYRAAFFLPLDHVFEHPIWGPTQVMRLDLVEVRRQRQHSRHPIARLLFRTCVPNVML